MKTLMLTTATATAIATAAALGAQADTAASGPVPGLLAGDVMGQPLYTLDTLDADALRAGGAVTTGEESVSLAEEGGTGTPAAEAFLAEREAWQRVGSVDDIVLTTEGEMRGVLVDIGGFLGFRARTVMVEMADIFFVAETPGAGEFDEMTLVLAMTQDDLDALPEWDAARLRDGFAARPASAPAEALQTDTAEVPEAGTEAVIDERFTRVEGAERTADLLIGAAAFDAAGAHVGTVEDVVIEVDNSISGVVIEVGSVLGTGAHRVHLPLEETALGWRAADDTIEVRLQTEMTAEDLAALPDHAG